MHLNYDNEKVLMLEIETDTHEIKDKIIITPSGLINTKRIKKGNAEDEAVFFGSKELEEETVNYIYI